MFYPWFMARPMYYDPAREDRLICAQLAETVRQATRQRWSVEYALERIRGISDRPDLLAYTAGTAIGRWIERPSEAEAPIIYSAGLLILAGADPEETVEAFQQGRVNRRTTIL